MELFNLHLFDGEGGESAGNAGQQTGGTETTSTPEVKELTPEERQKNFDDFKKANKDLFAADFQKAFNQRHKDYKQLEEKAKSQDAVISRLYEKYHVDNLDALNGAMDADDSLFIDAADEAGMSVEQFKQFKKLERENKQLQADAREREQREQADRQMQAWIEEEATVKQVYPDFSLEAEAGNQTFVKMLSMGFPMQQAYQAVHFNELMNNAIGATAKGVEKAVTDNIRAKGQRPAENGASTQGAFTTSQNVSKLTNKELAELAKRAKNGERIDFRS